jgi:methionyl-tRNA synthetase
LVTYLKPVLPVMAEQVEAFLNIDELDWHSLKHPLTKHKINKFKPLMKSSGL